MSISCSNSFVETVLFLILSVTQQSGQLSLVAEAFLSIISRNTLELNTGSRNRPPLRCIIMYFYDRVLGPQEMHTDKINAKSGFLSCDSTLHSHRYNQISFLIICKPNSGPFPYVPHSAIGRHSQRCNGLD